MVCVEQCVPNYNFTYIATGGAKKCLGECNKQGRTEAQYRLYVHFKFMEWKRSFGL